MYNQRTLDNYYADIHALTYNLEHLLIQFKVEHDRKAIEYIYNMCDGLGHHLYRDDDNKLGDYIKECCKYWESLVNGLEKNDKYAAIKIIRALYVYSNNNSMVVAYQCQNENQYHMEFDEIFNGWRLKLRRTPIYNNSSSLF